MSILARRFNPVETTEPPAAPALQVLPPPTSAAAPSGGLKKINLSGIARKKESGKTDHPVLPANPKAAEVARQILHDTAAFEALEGSLKQNKQFLIQLCTGFHFEYGHQKQLEKSIGILVDAAPDEKGVVHRVRVDFKDSYGMLENEQALVAVIGSEAANEHFHQSFTFKIESDKLPADKAGDIVGELQALFAKYNAADALTVKEGIAPNANFHLQRHLLFTPQENLAIQGVCPIRAAVATKNVK